MTFEELGPLLRAEREKKGLSVDDVALHLKISGRIIRALEDGDEDSLPHNVYVRGFVRSYAGFLRFNDEELNAAMDAVDFDENPAAPHSVYTPINENPLSRKTLFVIFLALCIVAVGGFLYIQESGLLTNDIHTSEVLTTAKPAPPLPTPSTQSPQATKNTPKAGTGQPASAVTTPNIAAPAPSVTPAPAPAKPTPVTQNSQAPQAAANAASANATANGAAGVTGSGDTLAAPRPGQPDMHKVIITALAECWIHSNADSTDTRQFSLRKGDTFALTFSKKLTLKLGNAGGVRIRYDGEDLPAPGTDGQVRTITFPLEQ